MHTSWFLFPGMVRICVANDLEFLDAATMVAMKINEFGSETFVIGSWTVEPDKLTLSSCERSVSVTPMSMKLLTYFAARQGKLITREDLLRDIWEGRIVSDETINRTIGYLRSSLGDTAKNSQYIQTVPRKGYRLLAVPEKLRTKSTSFALRPKILVLVALAIVLFVLLSFVKTDTSDSSLQLRRTPLETAGYKHVRQPRFSPSGRYLVSRVEGGAVLVHDLESGENQSLFANDGFKEFSISFSPSGEEIAFYRSLIESANGVPNCDIVIYNFKSRHSNELGSCDNLLPFSFSWMPDGQFLLVTERGSSEGEAHLALIDSSTGDLQRLLSSSGKQYLYPRLSPDGNAVAFVSYDGPKKRFSINVWGFNDADPLEVTSSLGQIWQVVWGEDNETLYYSVYSGVDEGLWRFELDSGRKDFLYSESLVDFDYSAPINRFAASIGRNREEIYHLREFQDQWDSKVILSTNMNNHSPAIHPRGDVLAYVSDQTGKDNIFIKSLNANDSHRVTVPGSVARSSLQWSFDGAALLFREFDQDTSSLVVYSHASEQITLTVEDAAFGVWSLRPGKLLVVYDDKPGLYELDTVSGDQLKLFGESLYRVVPRTETQLVVQKAEGESLFLLDLRDSMHLREVLKAKHLKQWGLNAKGDISVLAPGASLVPESIPIDQNVPAVRDYSLTPLADFSYDHQADSYYYSGMSNRSTELFILNQFDPTQH